MEFTKTTKASAVDNDRTVDKSSWKKSVRILASVLSALMVIIVAALIISVISPNGGNDEAEMANTVKNPEIDIFVVDGKHFHLSNKDLSTQPGESIKVHINDPSDQTDEELFFNIDNVMEGINLTAAMGYIINNKVNNTAPLRRMLGDDASLTWIDQFIFTEPYAEATGAYCVVETNECQLLSDDKIPVENYAVRRFIKMHPSEVPEFKPAEKRDAVQLPAELEKSPAEGDGRLRRHLAMGCSLTAGLAKKLSKANVFACDAKNFCKDQHLTFVWKLYLAFKAANRAFDRLKDSNLTPCDGGNGNYGRCDAGKGDVEDMLQHMIITGSLCNEVHSDTLRRGKNKAASIAQVRLPTANPNS